MDTNDKLVKIIEYKKLKGSIRKPKYATRKLSIGLVSCMLGYALLVSPTSVEAAEGNGVVTEESAETPGEKTAGEKDQTLANDDQAVDEDNAEPEADDKLIQKILLQKKLKKQQKKQKLRKSLS